MDKIGMLGNAINASYIVSVIEAPFSFGEKFFYIDEALFIENVYLNGRPCRIEWMWLRKNVVFPILTCEQQMLLKRTNDAGYNEFE